MLLLRADRPAGETKGRKKDALDLAASPCRDYDRTI